MGFLRGDLGLGGCNPREPRFMAGTIARTMSYTGSNERSEGQKAT